LTKAQDPCLTQGCGYFIENKTFEAYLEAHKDYKQLVRHIEVIKIEVEP
jgi:hypothetical protein